MKKQIKDSGSRRKFLSLGLLGGAGLIAGAAGSLIPIEQEEEMTSMLTPDGKLVQVSKKVLDQIAERRKAGNEDILKWTETQNKLKA